jgi:transcriptional regulator with XRE-family HTH domain
MRFGEKLRERRTEMGLTQAQLAEMSGLSKRTVIYYEQGKTYPRDRSVYRRLAEVLGIDADYLHNENDDFARDAMEVYGNRGKKQAEALMADVTGLFAGGDMADEDLDEFMKQVQAAYWTAKEKNRKYARKNRAER